MDALRGLFDFIDRSPTAFHAVDNIARALTDCGYLRLEETKPWEIVPGGRYFIMRNQSSIIAFRIPAAGFAHFQITASHSDSPCFKLKPRFERAELGYAMLNVEKYGGMLMSTWMDRPLSIAGRLILRKPAGLESVLINLDRNLALISNMPIHFNRSANDGVALNAQTDMLPVYGEEGASLIVLAAQAAGVPAEEIAGADLYLYNRDRCALWGADDAFIAAPRLDDLECAYASLAALTSARQGEHIDMLCVFDNEEVGSGTKQGADSTFLEDVIRRIAAALGADEEVRARAIAASFMLSADNAHAVHPNHPEKYDSENRVRMNGGVVVKSNAAQKYTSDGVSMAVFEAICAQADVPVQRFSNRSDIPGGSTLGNISNSHISMNTVDIGLAQLAMHSACESAGARDPAYMIRAMRAFFETEILIQADGRIALRCAKAE